MITIDKSDRHSCVMNKRLCVTFQQDAIPFFLSYANVVCVQPFTTAATALIPVISPFVFFGPLFYLLSLSLSCTLLLL